MLATDAEVIELSVNADPIRYGSYLSLERPAPVPESMRFALAPAWPWRVDVRTTFRVG